MKTIRELTEQEILSLTDEQVDNLIKLELMNSGIKIMDKPKVPELFEIDPADVTCYSIPILDAYVFTDFEEAKRVADALKSAKSFRSISYDWNRLGSDYKFIEKKERYKYSGDSDFSINTVYAYSQEKYASICGFAIQNKKMKEQAENDVEEYKKFVSETAELRSAVTDRVSEVRYKYNRLNDITLKFAKDYFPLSDGNEEMALKFMSKAYCLNDEDVVYIKENYNKYLE